MLPTKLYLDTARLGQTSPSALQAQIDFARLTAEDPSSLYFEKFLRDGVDACPEIADRFPGLAHWHGIVDLKRRLASMAGDPDQLRVLLANRSAELMRLAARCQFQVCRNVLVTDLSWPNWLAILKEEAERAGGRVTMAHISRSIMRDRCSSDDVCHHLSQVYATQECDGLFLPIVSNLGVHLPVAKIVTALRTVGPVNYTIADGAQALNHVDLTEPMTVSNFIVAGCHKWLRAYLPLGIGLRHTSDLNQIDCRSPATELQTARLNDPLARIILCTADGYVETANLTPLFSCSGALSIPHTQFSVDVLGAVRLNVDAIVNSCSDTGWKTIIPNDEFRAGILMISSRERCMPQTHERAVRATFADNQIAVSAYPFGLVRMSALVEPLTCDQLEHIRQALFLGLN